ncbi:hypothetical protein AX16_007150 [Volvariella volvacea WC 439]|nr:hypothetical protein AX16_007150 [Volvariella volvacea WC 439]
MADKESATISNETVAVEEGKEEVPAVVGPPDFPEGSLRGWLSLAGSTLVQYCTFGYTNGYGVYQDYYVRHYLTNYSPSEIGWIGGVQIFLTFSSGLITGRLVDRGLEIIP